MAREKVTSRKKSAGPGAEERAIEKSMLAPNAFPSLPLIQPWRVPPPAGIGSKKEQLVHALLLPLSLARSHKTALTSKARRRVPCC